MHQWLDLSSLTSLPQTSELTTLALTLCYPNAAFSTEQCSQLFQTILKNLQNPVSSPISKFYSLMILKELTERKKWEFFGVLTSHRLFGYMFDVARMVDPDKRVDEKGYDLFEQSEQIGNKFMRLILEEIKQWADTLPLTSSQQPNKYKKAYDSLIAKGVYLLKNQFHNQRHTTNSPQFSLGKQILSSFRAILKKITSDTIAVQHQQLWIKSDQDLEETIKLIKGFIQKSINSENINLRSSVVNIKKIRKSFSLGDSIQRFHEELSHKRDNYGDLSDEILVESPNVIDKFYKINDFMNIQRMYYRNFYTKCHYAQYIQQLTHSFQKIFQQQFQVPQSNILVHSYPTNTIQNISNFGINQKSIIGFSKSNQTYKNPTQNNQPFLSNKSQIDIRKSAGSIMDSNMFQKSSEIKNRFDGFDGFKEQLRKEVKQSRLDTKRTRSYSRKGKGMNYGKDRNHVKMQKQSKKDFISNKPHSVKITDSVFINTQNEKLSVISHFNVHSDLRIYPFLGKQVGIDSRLFSTIYYLQKTEDIRKFQLANFRDRSLLFQNSHIQLGYQTSTLYGNFGGFNTALKITLFIGNKTELTLQDFQIKDARKQPDRIRGQTLVYTTPQQIPSKIPPHTQYKVYFVLVIIKTPYGVPVLQIQYNMATFPHSFTVLLPCTLLKFVKFYTISQPQLEFAFQQNTGNLGHTVMRTEIFHASSYTAQLSKLIPQLQFLNVMYLTQKNTLIQCCKILLFNRFESILKFVTIRGESQMVIQATFEDPLYEYKNQVKSLLQSLHFLLKS